ncbi:S8 family peptidase [Fulvivirga lutea]|uniref:S8 family peptidase n=1 Tax=Fulvivirga lutea TaxID=2810512 RepID=A0A974WG68_9BACT|nr:S8 family peptidase [Fulvivirga lutea]QSE96452.1 S8 family peptidase [Fulvivirga lutea]
MFKASKSFYLSFLLQFILVSFTYSQTSIDTYLSKFEAKRVAASTRTSSEYVLIKLSESLEQYSLNQSGITVYRILDSRHIIGKINNAIEIEIEAVYRINNQWKLTDEIVFDNQFDDDLVFKATDSYSCSNCKKIAPNLYSVKYDKDLLEELLSDNEIIYVGSESLVPTVESRVLDMNLNPNKINVIHNLRPDLNGEGIVVSIQEQLFDKVDIDLLGRSINSSLESNVVDNHATEMSTIIAGAGNSFITGRGVADAAQITSSDFTSIVPDDASDFINLNAFIQNHSYGTEIENFYGALAEAYDQSSIDNTQLLHVFSSGNLGESTPESGTYAGLEGTANLTGNFKQSKNSLVVGSVDTVNNQPVFVSVGPAYDGRIKPELVAYSAVGASNSAALVSGVAALLQQEYKAINNEYPESALLKAALINGADDVGAKGIDFQTGYGSLNAKKSLQIITNSQFFSGSLTNGEESIVNLTVPPNAVNLKVTLCWTDVPGLPNSSKSLINDLDIKLEKDDITTLPWVLNETPSGISNEPTRDADHLNNVELISIEVPEGGDYNVVVQGFDIAGSPQPFYVTYSYDILDSFEWTFPTSTDNMPYNGETASYFRWETTLIGSGRLEYSIDDGNEWLLIDDNVNLEKGYYRWQPPSMTAHGRARIIVNGDIHETDLFAISRPLNVRVLFNCADSLLVSWPKIEGVVDYQLSTITNSNYLENFSITSDTSMIINRNQLSTNFLTVKPRFANPPELIGSPTFDVDLLGTNCFISSFSANVVENQIQLDLSLDLTYGAKEVMFETLESEQVFNLGTMPVVNLVTTGIDTDPSNGLNRYRATLLFDNGEQLVSDTIGVYYLEESKVLVFPNPLSSEDFLSVLTKDFDGSSITFQLINREGQLIFEDVLFSTSNSIALPDVTSGLYFYRIITNEGTITERLFILRE